MRQNQLYLIIGALVVAVMALGIYVYREESKPDGVELRIDEFRHFHRAELTLSPLAAGSAVRHGVGVRPSRT